MKKSFYNLRSGQLVKHVLFFEFQKILDKYYEYCNNDLKDKENDFTAFKSENGTIDIYYKNFHVFIVNNLKDKIVSINLKKNEENWIVNKDNPSVPINQTFEIYRWYDVTVYDTDKCMNEKYINGSWNEYFYKTLKGLDKFVKEMTDENQMLVEYSHVKK